MENKENKGLKSLQEVKERILVEHQMLIDRGNSLIAKMQGLANDSLQLQQELENLTCNLEGEYMRMAQGGVENPIALKALDIKARELNARRNDLDRRKRMYEEELRGVQKLLKQAGNTYRKIGDEKDK